MTLALEKLAMLATRLQVIDRQLMRIKGQRVIIGIAGTHGLAKPADGGERVNLILHPRADKTARSQLLAAGVLARVHGTDVHELRRLPYGTVERELCCELLGIRCRREMA